MYEGWQFEDWQTPVSKAKSLQMVSLVDDVKLSILLQDLQDSQRRRFRFTFENYPAYRNINESYRTELWRLLPGGKTKNLGWTFIVTDSPWIASFSQETLLYVFPTLVHYVISTEDDVIEILSPELPEIIEIEPQADPEPLPGKSVILNRSDFNSTEELIDYIKGKKN